MTYYKVPHLFTEGDIALAVTISRQLGFSIERLQAEQAKELLAAEAQHCIKNTLATAQAFVGQTLRKSSAEELDAFKARLRALGGAHELLTREVLTRNT